MAIRYVETMERMLRAGKLKNALAVAKVLGVTPQALSNYKKREKFPANLVIKFSDIYNFSLDWLINGEGNMYRTSSESPKGEQGKLEDISIKSIKPEYLIYIGKLVKILDSQDKEIAETTRHTIDLFYKAVSLGIEDEDLDRNPKRDVC